MSNGPIIIYDKSVLEGLSLDECVWFAQFYRANVTPLFFAETIADLEKEVAEQRTPEGVVSRMALKTAAMTADANADHRKLCAADLLGNYVDMRGVPAIEGGRSVAGTSKGLVFEISPEAKMLSRWQGMKFSAEDRTTAKAWRAAVLRQNPGATRGRVGAPVGPSLTKRARIRSGVRGPCVRW